MSAPLPFLTDDEILEMAKPLTQKAAIVRWCRANGWPSCKTRPNGMPLIFRSECETRQAVPTGESADTPRAEPNVQALLAKISKSGPVRNKV